MKIKGRRCDICGAEMGGVDYQYWLIKPKLKRGYPALGMGNCDICKQCFMLLYQFIAEKREEEKDGRKQDG